MKALENSSFTLSQLLDAGKVLELSKTKAAGIEDKQLINKLSQNTSNRNQGNRNRNANSKQDGDRPGNSRLSSSNKIGKIPRHTRPHD